MKDIREIKFRGQKEHGREWVYGNLIQFEWAVFIVKNGSFEERWRVIPGTVGQYTGLKDKNGNEIFEGDIVVFPNNSKYHIVDFHQSGFVLKSVDDKIVVYNIKSQSIEVVGNIYENPELVSTSNSNTRFAAWRSAGKGSTKAQFSTTLRFFIF